MAIDATTRTILIRMGISTDTWEKWVRRMKVDIDELHGAARRSHEDKMRRAQKEIDATQKLRAAEEAAARQKQLQAVADRAAAAESQKVSAAKREQLQQTLLETVELKKQATEKRVILDNDRQQLALDRQRLALEEARSRIAYRQAREAERTPDPTAVAQIKKDVGFTAFTTPAAPAKSWFGRAPEHGLEELGTEKQKLALMEAQLKVFAAQENYRKADIAAVQKEIAAERAKLNLYEMQVREKAKITHRGEAGEGGMLGGVTRGLFGGGMFGTLAGGAMTGFIGGEIFVQMSEKLRELGHELVESTGKAQQLREQFEKLTAARGVNPVEFLEKMGKATKGLVQDEEELQVANNYMQQGVRASSDQIARLTQLTIALARSQGRDAAQAMHALVRASLTGRTMMLAMTTGIDRQSLALRGLGQNIDPVTRRTLEFNKVLEAMEKRFAKIGEPALTLKDVLQQVDVAEKEFIQSIAVGMAGTKTYQEALQKFSKWLEENSPKIEAFGRALGEWLVDGFAELGRRLRQDQEDLEHFATLMSRVGKMFASASDDVKKFNEAVGRKVAPETWAQVEAARQQAAAQKELLGYLQASAKWAPEAGAEKLPPAETVEPTQAYLKQLAELEEKIEEEKLKTKYALLKQYNDQEMEANELKYKSGEVTMKAYLEREQALLADAHKNRISQIEAEAKLKMDKIAADQRAAVAAIDAMERQDQAAGTLTAEKMEVNERAREEQRSPEVARRRRVLVEEEMNRQLEEEDSAFQQRMLKSTRKGFDDEVAARRAYVQTINKINREGVEQRIADLEDEFAHGATAPADYIAQKQDLYKQERNLAMQAAAEVYAVSEKNQKDLADLRIADLQAEIDYQKKITELAKQEGDIRTKFLTQRYDLTTKILELDVKRRTRGEVPGPGVAQDLEAQKSITQAYISELEKIQATMEPWSEEWLQVEEHIAGAREKIVGINEQLFKARDIMTPLAELLQGISSELGGLIPKGWVDMLNRVAVTMEKVAKARQQLAVSGQTPLGALRELGQATVGIFRGQRREGAETRAAAMTPEQVFKRAQEEAAKVVQAAGRNVEKSGQTISQALQHGGAVTDIFGQTVTTTTTTLQEFASEMVKAIERIKQELNRPTPRQEPPGPQQEPPGPQQEPGQPPGGPGEVPLIPGPEVPNQLPEQTEQSTSLLDQLSSSIKKLGGSSEKAGDQANEAGDKQEAMAGAIQGAMKMISAGLSFVNTVMSSQTTASGIFGGAMSGAQTGLMFGPIGAAVGAIAGGVMGGVIGHKREVLKRDVDKIKAELANIVDQLESGTVTLGQSIADLRAERGRALDMLSKDKKGRGAMADVLGEIDAQLAKLLKEQRQILDELHTSLDVIAQAPAFQGMVQELDTIVKKYQEFASAAVGNTQEVALANQWLAQSLKNYANTLGTDLNAAHEQAIQDALQLLDLERQRFEIVQGEAKQEYDIMTRGVLQRQRGTAADKGYEIAQLRYQRDQQLLQIDQQIKLAQFKVDKEKMIFDLASTRIELEYQLLAAQEEAAGKQIDQIAAQQQVLAGIQQMITTGQYPSAILPGGQLATGAQILGGILPGVGLTPAPGVAAVPGGAEAALTQDQWVEQYMPKEFFSLVQDTLAAYPNYLQAVYPVLQTPSNSAQRKLFVDYFKHSGVYEEEKKRSSQTVKDWLNYLRFGVLDANTPKPPAYERGGVVGKTGVIQAEKGEYVIPSPVVSAIKSGVGYAEGGPVTHERVIETVVKGGKFGAVSPQEPPLFAQGGPVTKTVEPMATLPGYELGGPVGKTADLPPAAPGYTLGGPVTNTLQRPWKGMVGPTKTDSPVSKTVSSFATGGPVSMTTAVQNLQQVVREMGARRSSVGAPAMPGMRSSFGFGGIQPIVDALLSLLSSSRGEPKPVSLPTPAAGGKMSLAQVPDTAGARLSAENQVFDLASSRASLEMKVIGARTQQMQLEIQYMNSLQQVMGMYKEMGGVAQGGISFEGMLQKIYELRGRQGSAGFTRQSI